MLLTNAQEDARVEVVQVHWPQKAQRLGRVLPRLQGGQMMASYTSQMAVMRAITLMRFARQLVRVA